ncbi:MAG TPA: rhomboid family intramembrane serine protease [Puia sp.]|jgi:membrane associated rhomboid family serine protease
MEDSDRKRIALGQDGNALVRLVVINAVLFAILQFVSLIYRAYELPQTVFDNKVLSWFLLPASLDKLSGRPWTALTYMFADMSFFRFIGNLFWLWGFGYILQDLTGNRKLIPIYLYGGVAGALIFLVCYALIPGLHLNIGTAQLAGANASVMALAIATTSVAPDYRIFPMINGGIPLWILTALYLVINFATLDRHDPGPYIANLAGAGAGWLFIFFMRKGYDGSLWINRFFDWCNDLFNPDKKKKTRSPKDEFYYKVSGTQPFKKIPNITQQRIDEILDKINQQGYRFLTDEEKEILKRAADEEDL